MKAVVDEGDRENISSELEKSIKVREQGGR